MNKAEHTSEKGFHENFKGSLFNKYGGDTSLKISPFEAHEKFVSLVDSIKFIIPKAPENL